jgi:hypothetical protein
MNSINFSFETEFGLFSDAIVLSDEEMATITQAEIDAMKQTRLDNWLALVNSPAVEEAPTDVVEEAPTDVVEENTGV